MKRLWQNLIRACGQKRLPVAVLSFLAGFIIGSIREYDHSGGQRHLDWLLTPEGREYLRREFQEAPTNALPVVTPK